MDMQKTAMPDFGEGYEGMEQRIKDHLKKVVSQEVYDKWIEDFVFERIGEKEIIVGYYGTESLKEFKKKYQEAVWIHICSVVGQAKKMKIYKRKSSATGMQTAKMKQNIKVVRLFIISLFFAVIALAIAILGCNYIVNRNFKESFYNVSSLKANNKIRIIQISDLHNSTYGQDNSKLLNRIEKLAPHVILLTGDCADAGRPGAEKVFSLCEKLAQIAPSYYIYGNNEVETVYKMALTQDALDEKFGFNNENRNPQKLLEMKDDLEEKLEKTGVKVLKNEADVLKIGTTEVEIYGVLTSNPSAFWSYAGESFEQYINENPNNLKIMVTHEPFIYEEFAPESWGELMLCGHTHGGVARIPMLGPLYTHEGGLLPERNGDFVHGRYEVVGAPLIISAGLNNNDIFRINNQPEVVIVDINRF